MSAADQLAIVDADLEHHWFALRLHEDCIRQLQAQQRLLREAVAREDARIDRSAKQWCGSSAVRST